MIGMLFNLLNMCNSMTQFDIIAASFDNFNMKSLTAFFDDFRISKYSSKFSIIVLVFFRIVLTLFYIVIY